MEIIIRDLSKSYGGRPVLSGLNMTFTSQSPCCLMSPSGSGKTTLFRILMGLETADSGSIHFTDDTGRTLPGRPGFSVVFQEDRLCEAFTPLENVRMTAGRSLPPEQIRKEMALLLPEESLDRPVSTLSGGMKRRTALCRAILTPSSVLLMDEPFTGLDDAMRRQAIRYLLDRLAGRLLLLSTHSQEDVSLLGGKCFRLSHG
ncbi:MAG TPA: ATP-binding cassette domain-containing protein [Candidatus Enterocloster excrementipullorum]|uniref:ATP-binding cassette domain-containing protein n=1 Tax=Candidatus Enterocloster excrementipullorum TaxID=2838559 RepID=A0A9D2N338_9FIRM|nr:ATP-binding cassette domain-containing protein [Candidatus Enterocloster excrementipullorum]